ncbi:MAG: Hypothetical protein BHV28_17310 [Candidatus Tokpelaia hoelldobleri]|uniref:Uncharacterized protein n=1 Tax=Candidatus Tokpelaia hoelldobleri TaxID=1902579 RepID=A0A1U9JX48_9HYPH|nr:MAG: Hypothetical protein BHV28_17310 [Candidatus Tokpelaia hoelldoblerii]
MQRKTAIHRFKHFSFFLTLSFLLTTSPLAAAQEGCRNNNKTDIDTPLVQAIIRTLEAKDVMLAVCLPSPVHINQSFVALISGREAPECIKSESCMVSLSLLLVNNTTGKITRGYTEKNTLNLYTSTITSIAIDTTPYQLNPTTRANGVLIERERPQSASTIVSNELHLFTESGQYLVPVFKHSIHARAHILSGLLIKEDESTSEDTFNRYLSKELRTVDFGNYHNGFRDMVVNTTVIDIVHAKTIATTTAETIIPYDGENYHLPTWISYPY